MNTSEVKGYRGDLEYVGFISRSWAFIIDRVLLSFITAPLLVKFYSEEEILTMLNEQVFDPNLIYGVQLLAATITIGFWAYKQATPGKMWIRRAKIVDARTGLKPTLMQFVLRYAGYFLSALPFMIGFLWVIIDPKKRAWHDIISNTVVVRASLLGTNVPVIFPQAPNAKEGQSNEGYLEL